MKSNPNSFSHNGKVLSYVQIGSGPVRLLFFHGLGGASFLWKHQFDQFSNFECIAIDAFGHGESSKNLKPDEVVAATAAAARALVKNKLPPKTTILIAHSWGGNVVAEILAKDPDWAALIAVDALCIRDEETVKVYQDFSNQLRSSPDQNAAVTQWFGEMLGTVGENEDRSLAMQALKQCPTDLLVKMTGAMTKQPKIENIPPLYVFECEQYFSGSPKYSWNTHYKASMSYFQEKADHFFFLTRSSEFNSFLQEFLKKIVS